MICVVQRVSEAKVTVAGQVVGQIGVGLLVLASVHKDDAEKDIDWTAQKLAGLRIFPKDDKAYDLDVRQAGGRILLVSRTSPSRRILRREGDRRSAMPPILTRPRDISNVSWN